MNKKDLKKFLAASKEQRDAYVHGTRYYIDWDKESNSTQYFNWETNKVFKPNDRPPDCPKCKKPFIKDPDKKNNYWFDPCIGILPGVNGACCGHGVTDGYISFENGICFYFDKNVKIREGKCFDQINQESLMIPPDKSI